MNGEPDQGPGGAREEELSRLLRETAPAIADFAAARCAGGYVDAARCSWYHGVWPYLRVLGVVSSPAWHRDFYGKALRQVMEQRHRARPRVLVSGAADFSMLEQVLYCAREARGPAAEADVTVLDLCQTPLESCRLYAERTNTAVCLRKADLLDWRGLGETFDIITTDAVLTRFEREGCAEVISAWRGLLDADAVVVTTVRLHDDLDAGRDFESDIAAFVERVGRLAQLYPSRIFQETGRFLEAAETYARGMRSADIGDEDDIVELFGAGGFDVVSRERAHVAGELHPVNYLRIVARKRSGHAARV